MAEVNNVAGISEKTLGMLTTDVPLTKASRFLKLLTDEDLGKFRDFLEEKLKTDEKYLETLEQEVPPESGVPPMSVAPLVKTECLTIFDLMAKVDKIFETRAKAEAREHQKQEKAKHSKLQKILMEGGNRGGRGFGG